MAAAAILTFIYRSQLVYYCTYFYEISQVEIGGPTCTYAMILNKSKIQDVGGRHLGFCTNSNNSANN